ncbi:hypothetical protein B0T26DRAFT_733216 [Lasiosphaeria miniovina]|uniref:Apple domain-containing protein n=1 Tax=Lasiosphaeria miniovina TaxID=1954250 RepID=A0AA39ZUN3_9PEZI|nr:uncharacterized protein B0T26DRAFT_733216 [Lasiosphaeria miniovina]KAK0703913.1 hypothetical protein B0T26DRAFT_733216 [Lasiosphaeria miniovina]
MKYSASSLGLLLSLGPALAVSKHCPCIRNSALSVLTADKATAFCSSFLGYDYEPITVTTTPVTTVATTVITSLTATATDPQTVDAIEMTTSTSTSIVSSTSYKRSGGPGPTLINKRTITFISEPTTPSGLEPYDSSVISTACNCYVTSPAAAPTVTVTSAATEFSTATSSYTALTITESPAVATETVTVTVGALATTTVVVSGPPTLIFNLVATYTANCVPYNYQTINFGLTEATPSFEGAFQYCAAKCQSYAGCTQIYVSWDGSTSFDCMTGTVGTYGWDSSEFQCNYPPIHKNGYWFNVGTTTAPSAP